MDSTASGPAPTVPPGLPGVPINPPVHPPTLPTITEPTVLYQRVSPSYYGSDAYLLGANGAFVIVFPGGATHPGWSGRYRREDSLLVFSYDASSAAGDLAAQGTLHGDTLFLRYNLIMQLTDFEDGVYVRAPQ